MNMSGDYTPREVEAKWQAYWDEHKTFRQPNPGDPGFDSGKGKFYVLDMFPYPSGAGLHVGHPEGYTATDIIARYRRMRGDNVLHPMGWDSFGLPAEQHAVETGQHPATTTAKNITTFRRQMKMLGFSYDWDREIATTAPSYYRWTQWIFLKLFGSWYDEQADRARPIAELPIPADVSAKGKPAVREYVDSQRLAYLAEVPVNWCPALGTVLANEEVTNEGRSDRGNHPVYRRPLRQWMLRITKYARRLADDLEGLDWPESIKLMQRNWIGRSEGADVDFRVAGSGDVMTVYTTRPDTLFGATYMVLAPEHPLVEKITTAEQRGDVQRYCEAAMRRSDLARTAEAKEKTGVFTGAYALNPVWPEGDLRARIPIWVADYVLISYGTGAIMCVPGSDWRDYDFAHAFNLPIVQVVSPNSIKDAAQGMYTPDDDVALYGESTDAFGRTYIKIERGCFAGEGIAVNSPSLISRQSCGTGVSPVSPVTEQERATWRNLPHIQKGGSTHFMTFRVKHGELNPEERNIAHDACDYWHGIKATIHAVVVMPDHVHLLVTPHELDNGQWVSLGELLHSIKSYSSHEIAKLRGEHGSVWHDESFDRIVRDESEFTEKRKYIEANPVTAGLVGDPSDYRWLTLRQIGFQDTEHRRDAGATGLAEHRRDAGATSEACDINGLQSAEAKSKITAWLEERGQGKAAVNYKLRDWLFSRQRYWGEPFPILHGPDGELVALDESELPLALPEIDDYRPTPVPEGSDEMPDPPLGRARDWVTCQRHGKTYRRELNTMPQWAGSCWYYLRFIDPTNEESFCSKEAEQYWMGTKSRRAETSRLRDAGTESEDGGAIDLYLGGAEHAVLHLLYARFWHKVLYDLGYVSTPEPFAKLFNQGMIRAFAYTDSRGQYVGYEEVDFREDGAYLKSSGEKLTGAIEKMSKSLKNVISPEEVVNEYGADSFRLYEMFMGPLDASKPWNPRDVPGVFRFLQRAWRLVAGNEPSGLSAMIATGQVNQDLERALHKTIKKVTDDIERLAFNTAISAMMAFVNEAYRAKAIHKGQAERFVLLLSPFAPHVGEELWQRLRGDGWKDSVAYEPWPTFDPGLVVEERIEIPIQVNGKLVGRVTVAKDATQEDVEAAAMADAKVVARIGDKTIMKKIHVRGRLLNIVVKSA
ncbi:MAG: leucine--tRNA ligase [Phycisphaerae bacterium]|nr:leucine--tRNA ligase [Phycisphaerae bacterium]